MSAFRTIYMYYSEQLAVILQNKTSFVFELEFYGPANTVRVMSSRSVTCNLITRFQGHAKSSKRLTSTCEHTFASNWQLPFLNMRNRKNEPKKSFQIYFHESDVAELGIELADVVWSADRNLPPWYLTVFFLFFFLNWYTRKRNGN